MLPRLALLLLAALLSSRARGADTAASCDLDGDGHDALFCDGDDCNDADETVFPGADEVPGDGVDQDCDGLDPSGGVTWAGSGGSLFCGSASGSPTEAAWIAAVLVAMSGRRRGR